MRPKHGIPYTKLEEPWHQIRLCCIKPKEKESCFQIELKSRSLEEVDGQYSALSYAWGLQESPSGVTINGIDIDGSLNGLTQNLYTHLYRLRELEYTGLLWVDAICINQFDNDEKQHQVALMGSIFAKASDVFVCLDEATTSWVEAYADHKLVGAVLEQLAGGTHVHELDSLYGNASTDTSDRNVIQAIRRISDSAWFQRVWVVQEVCLAKRIHVLLADKFLPWSTFHQAFFQWNSLRHQSCCSTVINRLDPQVSGAIHRTYIHLSSINHTKAGLESQQHVLDAMLCFQHLDAKLPVDKFNGYRGLHRSEGDPMPPPDYDTSPEKVFEQLTVWLLHSCGNFLPLILGLCGRSGELDLPSWVLDISAKPTIQENYWRYRTNLYKSYPYILDRGLNFVYDSQKPGKLQVSGMIVDRIRAVVKYQVDCPGWAAHITLLNKWCRFATSRSVSEVDLDDPRDRDFCNTMLGGMVRQHPPERFRQANVDDFAQWRDSVLSMENNPNDAGRYDAGMFSHLSLVLGQALFLTEGSSLGLGPQSLQPGDSLWLFAGGTTTFAMRLNSSAKSSVQYQGSSLDDEYILLGPCYHNRTMQSPGVKHEILPQPSFCVIT